MTLGSQDSLHGLHDNPDVHTKAMSHGAAWAANLKGTRLVLTFYLGTQANHPRSHRAPCETAPSCISRGLWGWGWGRGQSLNKSRKGSNCPLGNRYEIDLILFSLSHPFSYPLFSPRPSFYPFCFNISEWTPIIYILMSPHRGQIPPSEKQHCVH